jgi:thiol-disulfide isomerase/thioredoxin
VLAACGHAAASGPPPVKSVRLNAPGAMVDVNAALVADYVTIIDFWSDSCGACKIVGDKVNAAIANDARVIVREVDVGDGVGDLAHAYDINALPHYNVYDRSRKLRYVLVGSDCLRAPELARALAEEK